MLGNGRFLPQDHYGPTTLTIGSHSFHLNNLLYVPSLDTLAKNLIFVK